MVSSHNLLKPSAGEPIVTPAQDMVLGCYYLTKILPGTKGEGMAFASLEEAVLAYQSGVVTLHAPIKCRFKGELMESTLGRFILNSFLPEGLPFYNQNIGKKQLGQIVSDCFERLGRDKTAPLVDNLKYLGFKFATKSGITIAQADMIIPKAKEKAIEDASETVKQINNQYWKGLITENERYNHTLDVWSKTKAAITTMMINSVDEDNNIFYIIDSGARGNWGQVTQLCGIKGLVANPAGKTIELPIKSNLKEGFTILEYFIATHGGRKGKSDTALKTAEAGYLTRRLVDSNQDVVIREHDCGSKESHTITQKESDLIGEKFETRIYGRTLAENLVHLKTGEILQKGNTIIEKETLRQIQDAKIDTVRLRSVMTCLTENGICVKCYGKDLGTNEEVELGTAVGIIAAQSIGEPGTQLTMRTFHMGGVAGEGDITQGLTRVEELFEARTPKNPGLLAEINGTVSIHQKGPQTEITITSSEPIEIKHALPADIRACVKVGDKIKRKMVIAKAETHKGAIKAIEDGKVSRVTEDAVYVVSEGLVRKTYRVPTGRTLKVKTKAIVKRGQPMTDGHLDLRLLMELTDTYTVQKYIVNEVQSIYASQGQSINDKHIEIIARQMLSKVRLTENGDSDLLPGEIVDVIKFNNVNSALAAKKKKEARGERLLLGLTRVALYTDSWLSAASFQETIRVLVEASTTNRIDVLDGLKENVIIGKLIPAGEIYRKRLAKDQKPVKETKKEKVEKEEEVSPEDEALKRTMTPVI
jgi:DNA-directed RNA polymerase subunit beta'